MRRTVLLEEMFNDCATLPEKRKLEELYAKHNKGSATVLMIRTIKSYWDLHIAKKDKPDALLPDKEVQEEAPRLIKFNYAGKSWYEPRGRLS